MAAGDKYLDRSPNYAAVFNADGTGRWEALTLANPNVAAGVPVSANSPAGYQFENLADICVNTCLAAGAAARAVQVPGRARPPWSSPALTVG